MWPLRVSQILTVPSMWLGKPVLQVDVALHTILGARNHPFTLAVECNACDIPSVALEGNNSRRVSGLDVVELDVVVAGGSEEALVRRYA